MHPDVLEQARVGVDVGGRELALALRHDSGRRQELGAPALAQGARKLVEVGVGAELDRGQELADAGLDRLRAHGAGHRHAMVTIDHEIGFADLVEVDRREALRPLGQPQDSHPALAQRVLARQEGAGEIARALERAHDALERDFADAAVDEAGEAESLANLGERDQVHRPPEEGAEQVAHQRRAARRVELGHGRRISATMHRSHAAFALVLLALLAAPAAAGDAAGPGWRHDWARGAVFYEIFVRSFADSDGDGIGDLRGLTAKLDYLNDGDPATGADLGVDALWLMPIFASPSYHGYDVTDYEAVEPRVRDPRRLRAAARRGAPARHPGHPRPGDQPLERPAPLVRRVRVLAGFRRGATGTSGAPTTRAGRSPGAAPTRPGTSGAAPTTTASSGAACPTSTSRTPAVRAEMKRLGRALARPRRRRLPARRHPPPLRRRARPSCQNDQPETHAFLRELAAYVRAVRPDAVLVGENWTDTDAIAAYYGSTATVAGRRRAADELQLPARRGDRRGGGERRRGAGRRRARLAWPRSTRPA